jgi:PAS domain S-box-containing protein
MEDSGPIRVTGGNAPFTEPDSMLDTMLENASDFIYFKDRESRLVRFSHKFLTLAGTSDPDSLKGKTDFDLFGEEHARQAYEDEQRIIQTGQPIIGKLEKETHRDGQVTWSLTTKMPWRDEDGNIIGTFGISRDVTEIKNTEAKLAYERELFRMLLNSIPDAIYFKDLESHFVRLSRAKVQRAMLTLQNQFRTAQGPEAPLPSYLTDEDECARYLEGKSDFDLCTDKEAREFFEEEMRIIRTGEAIPSKIASIVMPDGKPGWFYVTKMPWRDERGNIIGTFGISRDITALKDAEAELEQRTIQLQREIRERERIEYQHAIEAERARIARDLHDDLGSSLTELSVLASTGQRPHIDEASQAALFCAIDEKARSLIAALDGIVWAVDPEDNSLQSLADYLSGYVDDYVSCSGIACRLKVPVTVPPLTLDGCVRYNLLLAVKETLNNIVRHSQATEVEFRMTVANGGTLDIVIADNGKGFESSVESVGYGLSNISARLNKLGGSCVVESSVGSGTVVSMRLPLPAPAKASAR